MLRGRFSLKWSRIELDGKEMPDPFGTIVCRKVRCVRMVGDRYIHEYWPAVVFYNNHKPRHCFLEKKFLHLSVIEG